MFTILKISFKLAFHAILFHEMAYSVPEVIFSQIDFDVSVLIITVYFYLYILLVHYNKYEWYKFFWNTWTSSFRFFFERSLIMFNMLILYTFITFFKVPSIKFIK